MVAVKSEDSVSRRDLSMLRRKMTIKEYSLRWLGFHPGWASTVERSAEYPWDKLQWDLEAEHVEVQDTTPNVLSPASKSCWCRTSSRGSCCFRDTSW